MFERMKHDVQTVMERDPAARSKLEVVLAYPGVHAIWIHRVAHRLFLIQHPCGRGNARVDSRERAQDARTRPAGSRARATSAWRGARAN